MRCFYHQDREAVGVYKACGKGICAECAVDLGEGLACKTRCEDQSRKIIELVDRNLERLATAQAVRVVSTPEKPQQANPSSEFLLAQLASHIDGTVNYRNIERSWGCFSC